MKKLALILLISVYSIAVFGAGTGAFVCCDTAAVTFTNSTQNTADAVTASNEDCGNSHHSTAFKNHHIAAATIHFSARHHYSIQPHTGFADIANVSSLRCSSLVTLNNYAATPNRAVPVYILHCVYRI